jgi:hypothetical protein
MTQSSGADRQAGHYLGTEVDEKWWKRYTKDKLLARGNGEYWIEKGIFCFRRYLTKAPIEIRFEDILDIKIGTWHSGKWYIGRPIMKLVWTKDGVKLSSGFYVSKNKDVVLKLVDDLKERVRVKKQVNS